MTSRFVNPNTMGPSRGYTHIVETSGPGRTVYLSGQLGMTPDGKFAGAPGDFRAQVVQAFENVRIGLASVGGRMEHIVKITNFFIDMANLPVFFEVRDTYVNTKAPPASTAVEISKLARDGALFEIEAVAVIPGAARPKAAGAKRSAAKRGAAKKPARKKR
ncbi:MAG: RidA family protein [Hyphomicrobiales bacterium]|nr:RidA family protein [Alphaproteobacteria bacterium]